MRRFNSKIDGGKLTASLTSPISEGGNVLGIQGVWIDVEHGQIVKEFTTLLPSEADEWYEDCITRIEQKHHILVWRKSQ